MKFSSFTKPSNSFSSNVLKLVSGTTFVQVLGIFVAPILTRLYAPEVYGIVALFGSLTGIIGVIACMRYELAIMLPERDEEAANLLGVSLGFTVLISFIMIPIVWWGRIPVADLLNTPVLAPYLWMAPVAVFLGGISMALNYWNSRTRHFGRLSIAQVTNSLTATPLMLGLGFVGRATAGSMIGSGLAGQAVSTSILGGQIWKDDRKTFLSFIRWRSMKEGIHRYKKFPIFDSWAGLMNIVSLQLPPLLLAFFFSPKIVGFYALGYLLLSKPISLIGNAFSQVFFQRAALAKNDGTLSLVVKNTFTRLVSLGSFPFLLIMIIGEDIFSVVFGNQWTEAGIYAQILAPWILLIFFGSPLTTLFSVLEIQERFLIFNSLLLVTRAASLIAGGLANSILMALGLYAGTGAMMWLGLCLYILWKSGLKIRLLAGDILQIILVAIISIVPVLIIKNYYVTSLYIVIAGCVSGLIYYTMIYFKNKEIQLLVKRYVDKYFPS